MFLSSASHNYANDVSRVSSFYQDFIEKSLNSGVFENTLFIFFSDHGIRFGPLRATDQGWLEDRMPFMFLLFPKWFQEQNQLLMDNLKENDNRLSTFFDVYETLKDILNFDSNAILKRKITPNQRGISLFNEIPLNRSCLSAQIPFEYCACISSSSGNLKSDEIKISAIFIVNYLNNLLKIEDYHCAKLELDRILDSKQMSFKNGYVNLLTIRVNPSKGIFEGMVEIKNNNMESLSLKGEINRINKYGRQSHCVKTRSIREFCMCKDLIPV